jgi:cytochrome c-type biogenesis protein CcmH/NrfG
VFSSTYNIHFAVFYLVKGWIRKGKILQGMQKPNQALSAYQKAIDLDPNNAVS